jgi:cell wall-associated NlpC family hydrolase
MPAGERGGDPDRDAKAPPTAPDAATSPDAGSSSNRRSNPPRPLAAIDSYALVGTALELRGAPYRDGGADPRGFDCSGFTQYVFARHGVSLPRATRDQFELGELVAPRDLTRGDLLFFSTTAPGASHVGIAVGDDQFVHAPSSTGVVRVERLSSSYWSRRFVGARRIGFAGAMESGSRKADTVR